jgi:transcriptional regulator with XRE-family HTH domain
MVSSKRTRLGEMIKQARERRGWSQYEFGRMIGYRAGNFVAMIEGGRSHLPLEKIPLVADLLGLDSRNLLREALASRYPELVKFL